jgi:hypothetical protein
LGKNLIKNLFLFFLLLFRSKFWTIQLTTLILLPGTIVHEISHLIVAEILRVKTGEISFIPKIEEEERIQAGSVQIKKVDPFRRTLVGIAPLLSGLTIIFLISKFYFLKHFFPLNINQFIKLNTQEVLILFTICYLIFAISNTMFSSKEDLKAAILPTIILFMAVSAFYLGGFSIKVEPKTLKTIKNLLTGVNLSLGLTITIDFFSLGILKLILKLFKKLKR